MTLKEIVFDIRNAARAGGIVDDERISERQVAFWVNHYRALLIRRDLDKGKTISDNISQDLGCLSLIVADKAECCDLTSDCEILRTEVTLPTPIELSRMDAITYVGNIDRTKGYELTSPVMSHWDKYSRYTSKVAKAYYLNGYIYITNETFLKWINVQGIFQDPTEAGRFNTCDGEPCYTASSDYPVSSYMVPTIKQMIFQQELKLSLNTTPDVTNNAEGDPESQGR
jgi:hypothetical protein